MAATSDVREQMHLFDAAAATTGWFTVLLPSSLPTAPARPLVGSAAGPPLIALRI